MCELTFIPLQLKNLKHLWIGTAQEVVMQRGVSRSRLALRFRVLRMIRDDFHTSTSGIKLAVSTAIRFRSFSAMTERVLNQLVT
jgi:hypothetical protein